MKEHATLEKRQILRNNEYYWMQPTFDKLYSDANKGKKFRNLMELICEPNNILLAYRKIKRNKGSRTAGTDGLNIKFFETMDSNKFVERIQNKLKNYSPKSVRRREIPKPNGKTRPLGIPCIEDRIIQQTIRQILEPICEAKFHPHSYGFRPNRSAHHALSRAMYLVNRVQANYVVDIDIKGFFDNVNHSKLIKQMWHMGIQDKNLIAVINKILKSEIDGIGIPNKGTPQGGIISPLLSNIVLNELDWWLSSQWESFQTKHDYGKIRKVNTSKEYIDYSHRYRAQRLSNLKEIWHVRYADDFKIYCKDHKTAFKIYTAVTMWLKERLGLEISPEKSKVTNLRKNHTEFLGIKMTAKPKRNKYVCKSNMCDKAVKNCRKKIKEQIKKIQKSQSGVEAIKFNSMVLGMHNYYKVASNVNLDFDHISFSVLQSMKVRLREYLGRKACYSETFKRIYGKYVNAKPITVMDVTLFPIYGVINEPPKSFNQKVSNYTKDGRELVHKDNNGNIAMLISYYLNRGVQGLETELYDNSVSLIAGQLGKCGVTGLPLEIGCMELHHKVPRSLKGGNEYKNLIWVHTNIHRVIHATKTETIDIYLNSFELDQKARKKINTLRALVENSNI